MFLKIFLQNQFFFNPNKRGSKIQISNEFLLLQKNDNSKSPGKKLLEPKLSKIPILNALTELLLFRLSRNVQMFLIVLTCVDSYHHQYIILSNEM